MFLSTEQLKNLDQNGYVIVKNALDPETTVDRVFNEYEFVLDKLCKELYENGEISSTHDDLNFDERVIAVYQETNRSHVQYFDFSLPLEEINEDTPMWHGPEVFRLLTNPDLLDVVESVIGPETKYLINLLMLMVIKKNQKKLDLTLLEQLLGIKIRV